jgi:hypothetical protein
VEYMEDGWPTGKAMLYVCFLLSFDTVQSQSGSCAWKVVSLWPSLVKKAFKIGATHERIFSQVWLQNKPGLIGNPLKCIFQIVQKF